MSVVISDDVLAFALDECEELANYWGMPIYKRKGEVGIRRARELLFTTSQAPLVPNYGLRDAAKRRAAGRCEVCGKRTHDACTATPEWSRPIETWADNPLWIEHALPRLAHQAIGVRNDVMESEANIGATHKSFNQFVKGTQAFTPQQIAQLWQVHDYGADTEHAPAVLLGASIITAVPTMSALRLPVLDDLIRPVTERPALGALLRKRPDVAVELEHVHELIRDWRTGLMRPAHLIRAEQAQADARRHQTQTRRRLRSASKRMPA